MTYTVSQKEHPEHFCL